MLEVLIALVVLFGMGFVGVMIALIDIMPPDLLSALFVIIVILTFMMIAFDISDPFDF